ncbi:MAG: twin-arginine translocation signal domain-containing protein, partial [Bacteroidota bacterium]
MDRRDFIKKTFAASALAAAGTTLPFGQKSNLWALGS